MGSQRVGQDWATSLSFSPQETGEQPEGQVQYRGDGAEQPEAAQMYQGTSFFGALIAPCLKKNIEAVASTAGPSGYLT